MQCFSSVYYGICVKVLFRTVELAVCSISKVWTIGHIIDYWNVFCTYTLILNYAICVHMCIHKIETAAHIYQEQEMSPYLDHYVSITLTRSKQLLLVARSTQMGITSVYHISLRGLGWAMVVVHAESRRTGI